MKKQTLIVIGGVLLAIVLALVFFVDRDEPTPEMVRADTVLVRDPALRDSLVAKAESIRVYMDSTKLVKKERNVWKKHALSELAKSDTMRAVDSLKPTLAGKDSIIRHLRFKVIPEMQRVWHLDSLVIARQDTTIADLTLQYNRALLRGDTAIVALADLRKSIKPPLSIKLPIIGWRIPVKDIVIAATSYCIGGGNPC
jgi:hypothetical protein